MTQHTDTILYSHKILDPKSKTVHHLDDFYVCKKIEDKWYIIEGHMSASMAFNARKVLMRHDLTNGHITTPLDYRIFKKGLNTIKETLDE